MRLPFRSATLLLAAAPALAQGSDDCASATAITGNGPFSCDTTTATTDGLADPVCDFFGNQDIFGDVWFSWTATESGPHAVNLCNLLGDDSKAAVYDGGCGTTVTWCNDDACGLKSQVAFDATQGQTYLIRIGNYADGSPTPVFGDFTIDYAGPTLNPATGNYYQVITENLSWNGASAAAEANLFNGTPGHLVTITDQAELDWILANLTFDRPWIGLFHNTQASDYSEPAMGWQWVTGETSSFFNWSPGEPNNISASGGPEDYCEMFGNGAWNDAEDFHGPTFEYIVEWEGGSIGTNYCQANPNSTSAIGTISASGSASAAADDFTLTAGSLPTQQFGIFITSRSPGFVPNAGGASNGNLCLGGAIGRFFLPSQIKSTGAIGEFSLQLPLTMFPQGAGVVAVMPGETWFFQAWHRDGVGAGSNFTDGLEVTFN